jgi:hypothetical protein
MWFITQDGRPTNKRQKTILILTVVVFIIDSTLEKFISHLKDKFKYVQFVRDKGLLEQSKIRNLKKIRNLRNNAQYLHQNVKNYQKIPNKMEMSETVLFKSLPSLKSSHYKQMNGPEKERQGD